MNTAASSVKAWISGTKSGNITPNNAVLAVGVPDMTEMLESFALHLRELRKQNNLSQTELGKLAELHYTHIGRYERGASQPSGNALKHLADVLGVTSDYLLEGAADETAKVRFEDHELLQQFHEVEHLSDDDKHVVMRLLDAGLTKKHSQVLAR